ncbi:Metallo-dependent hydrolase [Dothidotthia symphoricarpi CBS 119687]|uniref:Metallo-dependent hydrolase n=1 Tax=Dothidotthia symphoricarpi CBS 119687 TaxID=1392245 RepID=A0A6A6A9D4_9PLEO|nr:Metallo-dependent hydrolase [Dothidotthia symphoricarpi CBS 119687]KAF2127803.1 Metallo-dependent hydrolase [Dothidotthia symphoricarpi CBS 119687]
MTPPDSNDPEPFPWHLGVYDAHCHPTDTMSTISSIPAMKTRILTVMATRIQDQDLVTSTAETHGIRSSDPAKWSRDECVVPCFGWHPWFAHQMYFDDEQNHREGEKDTGELEGQAKLIHYQNVFQPHREVLSEEDQEILQSLPSPIPFSAFLAETREHLVKYPYALIGEVGLDRAFRVPSAWSPSAWSQRDTTVTPGGREGRRLTPFRCSPQHQKRVFKEQLQLAAEMGRAVSVHGVQAHGLVFESLQELWAGHEKVVLSKREKKRRGVDHESVAASMDDSDANPSPNANAQPQPYPPRICLHSFSGPPSVLKQYLNPIIPVRIFASFSTAINLSDALDSETPAAFEDVIKTVPDHMLLVESDLDRAGSDIDTRMEDIIRRICRIKGWNLTEGVQQLGKNWHGFVFGS